MLNQCPNCGAVLVQGKCEYCGYRSGAAAATETGVNQETYHDVYSDTSDKNRGIAFILAFLFGMFGVHYFYVGKTGWGIVHLLTCGFFGIGWMIDLVRIAAGTFTDSDGLRLRV